MLAFCMHADKVKSSCIWVASATKRCADWSPGGHFPSSMDRLLTFWLAAGLTLPVHHWGLSIPQHLETAHKFKGLSMNSASQHPLKELQRTAIKKNGSISLTLIFSLAKRHRNKWLGTLCRSEKAECWQPLSEKFYSFCVYFCCIFHCVVDKKRKSGQDDFSKVCLKNGVAWPTAEH